MSNHTTGPWIYAIPGDSFVASDSGLICRRPAVSGGGSAPNNWEANASLIAAAPDLLEALKACDEAMSYMSEYDIPITLPAQVKAAIAKAEGGAA